MANFESFRIDHNSRIFQSNFIANVIFSSRCLLCHQLTCKKNQLTCSCKQELGSAAEDPGRSGGTLGSRCPPFGTRNLSKRLHQRCSLFKIVKVCASLSWKTWMTFCSRRTGRVRQLACCHWKAWIDGELDQREGELASPLQTPIPAPTILPWAENWRNTLFTLFRDSDESLN